MVNSRSKGKRGELEFCRVMKDHGWEAHRSQQFSGADHDADITSGDLPWLHIEVKRRERGNIHDWMDQAKRDTDWQMPLVAHRRNNCEWLVTLTAADFFAAILPMVETDKLEDFLRLMGALR